MSSTSEVPARASRVTLRPIPMIMFGSRWLQLPLYVGLIVAQGVYVVLFLKELWHLLLPALTWLSHSGSSGWPARFIRDTNVSYPPTITINKRFEIMTTSISPKTANMICCSEKSNACRSICQSSRKKARPKRLGQGSVRHRAAIAASAIQT
jgi:hypothetical protein